MRREDLPIYELERSTVESTRIRFVTEGSLLRQLVQDLTGAGLHA
jgi:HrpA-like RNA helicase